MIFINELLSRVQKSDRSDVLARVYFVSSLVFFVCPVFYIFFWKIPDKVLPETEENQVVTAAVRLVFCGRIIMASAIIMWALSLVYLLANGVI